MNNEFFLTQYREEIRKGNIVVGQQLLMELDNLMEDLNNPRYYYDPTEAYRRIHFMENCIRLTKSPFYNKPMKLMLWQKAWIEAFYSFKMSETGFDRFKKTVLEIARKNTKSETSSGLGLTELILGSGGADIVCSSNDDPQADILYQAINTMRLLIDPLELDTKKAKTHIENKVNRSKVFKLSDRTRNKEGRNIDFAIVDEAHEMKTNVIFKSIEQSQSLKDNPKLIIISTEGFVNDGFLDNELKSCQKIITKEDTGPMAEITLPWLYTQDSELEVWQDESSWPKSNPTLGVIKKWSYLREQIDAAQKSKADRIFVLSKDFNIKQSSQEAWLFQDDYEYEAVYDLEDFRGSLCLGAVDLAETTDLVNAKILMLNPNDPKDKTKYVHTMYFIPESKLDDKNNDKNAGAKYAEWAKQGLITICEGNDVDLTIVADWFYKIFKEYGIKLVKCGYDVKFSKEFLNRMELYGFECELILQNATTLNAAMRLVEADFKSRLINYNQNAVDRWNLSNAGIEVDNKCQCMCVKMEIEKRIDGAVCLIILYETFRRFREILRKRG